MSSQTFVPDDPAQWDKRQAPAFTPDDPAVWDKGQSVTPDPNARLLGGHTVQAGPTASQFETNMAFHRKRRAENPLIQAAISGLAHATTPASETPTDTAMADFHAKTINSMLDAVDAVKSTVEFFDPKLEKTRAAAQKAMDVMAAGNYLVAGTALQSIKIAKGEASFRDLVEKGLINPFKVLGTGQGERPMSSDVLGELGVQNPVLKYGGGLLLDVATNPYNLIRGAGLSKLGKAAEMFNDAKNEARINGTPLPDWEAMARNGNRRAKTIADLIANGQEAKLETPATLAQSVEMGHRTIVPGGQIPGVKRLNVAKLKFDMGDEAYQRVLSEHPGLLPKDYVPGNVLPGATVKALTKEYGDEAYQMMKLGGSQRISVPNPLFPVDPHNPVAEFNLVPQSVQADMARVAGGMARFAREYNPDLVKPGVKYGAQVYGNARKGLSDALYQMDGMFNAYPRPVLEGKLMDPLQWADLVRFQREAINQKGDLTRELVDKLFQIQSETGSREKVLDGLRKLKMDRLAPDTYRSIETLLSTPVTAEEFAKTRAILEEGPRAIVPNRDLPNEWELRHFGSNDPHTIFAIAQERLGKDPDFTQSMANLEKRLNQHVMDEKILRAAAIQAAYDGTPEMAAGYTKRADEVSQSFEHWNETYRKITDKPFTPEFGVSRGTMLPAPRPPAPTTEQQLQAAQAGLAQLQVDTDMAGQEQRALVGALEASPVSGGPTNETLMRLERANQRAVELQKQMQVRVQEQQRLAARLVNEQDVAKLSEAVKAGVEKMTAEDLAKETARLERHPAMQRPASILPEVRAERERLPAGQYEDLKTQTVGDYLKTRYGDNPEDYRDQLATMSARYERSRFKSKAAAAEKASAARLKDEVASTVEPAAPAAAHAYRPAVGTPRVPIRASGLPVPSAKPVTSAIEKTSFGSNNLPSPADFQANREAGGSTIGLLIAGGQDHHGGLPPFSGSPGPGGMSMPEYQAWLTRTFQADGSIGKDVAKEIADPLIAQTPEGWARTRAIRDLMDALIVTENGRQKIVGFLSEYFPHVYDKAAAFKSPLAHLLGGIPKGPLRTPGFAKARAFRETFDDLQSAAKLVNGKPLLVDDVVTALLNRVAPSAEFQAQSDFLNKVVTSLGLSGEEIRTALAADGITEIPNAKAAANIVNSHYWMRKMGMPADAVAKVESLNNKLRDLGVWRSGGLNDLSSDLGVGSRLRSMMRDGTIPVRRAKDGSATVDLNDALKSHMMKATGAASEADLIGPLSYEQSTRVREVASAIQKQIRATMSERDVLSPRLKLYTTKGEFAKAADSPDFVAAYAAAHARPVADMGDPTKTLIGLDPSEIPNFDALKGAGVNYYLLPEEVANHINGHINNFMDNSGPRNFVARVFNKMTNMWKVSVTSLFPEFHLRNWMTNLYQLHVYAGVDNPEEYAQAMKIQLGHAGSILRDDGSMLTHQEVRRLAQKQGVLGHGQFGGDIENLLDPRRGAQARKAAAAAGIPTGLGRDMGKFVEENARMTAFINGLKSGMSPYAAGMRVKKYLFDYMELSKFERNALRPFFPFYAWARKNIPLQLSEVLKAPATASTTEQVRHAISGFMSGKDMTPDQFNALPDWMKPMSPFLYEKDGKPKASTLAGKLSPMSDVMQLAYSKDNPLKSAGNLPLSMLNPLLKEPIEQVPLGKSRGRDLQTGQELFNPEGLTRTMQIPFAGRKEVPARIAHAMTNFRIIPLYNAMVREAAGDTTVEGKWADRFKVLFGFRGYDVNFDVAHRVAVSRAKKALEELAPLKPDGRINFNAPLVKEMLGRKNRGAPPMSTEERDKFKKQLDRAREAMKKEQGQHP